MSSIAILGSGVMGSALAVPLSDNGHDVRLVGTHLDPDIIDSVAASGEHRGLGLRLPESVRAYQLDDAEEAFDGVEIVLSGVNSFGVRWAGDQLARLLRPDMLVIAIAKGLDANAEGDLRILPEVLAELVPADVHSHTGWAAITGPSIAGEVASRRDTCVVFAGEDQRVTTAWLMPSGRTPTTYGRRPISSGPRCARRRRTATRSRPDSPRASWRDSVNRIPSTAYTTTRPPSSLRATSRCAGWSTYWADEPKPPTGSQGLGIAM
jgi:predicted dinucleotide-binding enzyme